MSSSSPFDPKALKKLHEYVTRCGGDDTMLDGWSAHTKARESGAAHYSGQADSYWYDAHGKIFRSMAAATRSLGLEPSSPGTLLTSDPKALEKLHEYVARCGGDDTMLDGWSAQTRVREPNAAYPHVRTEHVFIDSQSRRFASMAAVARFLRVEPELLDRNAHPTGPRCSRRPIKRPCFRDDYISEAESRACSALSAHCGPSEVYCSACGHGDNEQGNDILRCDGPGCGPACEPVPTSEISLLDADNVRVLDAGDVGDGSAVVVCAEVYT